MASLKDLIVMGPARFLDKIYGNLEGNATSADKLKTARSISLSGAVKGSATFDGSGNIGIATTFAQGMNYAGSSSDGGAANSALKLVDSANKALTIGSANKPVYFSNGIPVEANTIENAKSAEYLSPGATINGTLFDGKDGITTSSWGAARVVTISDNSGTNTQANNDINGSSNFTLKLPATIKANLTGKATSAGTADSATTATTATTCTGNAATATKLKAGVAINGTNFDGSGAITTSKWGTARNITIGSKTKSVDGSTTYNWTHTEIGATVSNSWTAGGTAGPKISTTVNGVTGTAVEIPSASTSASGVVTTENQRFRGTKTLEYPAITSNATRYQGYYYKSSGGTLVGDHWIDIGDASKVTQNIMYWRLYSPKATADTATTGSYEQYYLPAVTIGRSTNASYEIFTSKSYTTLDSRYVNVSGDTMTGDLKFTTNGIHFKPGDTDQFLWKVYSSSDGSHGFRLQYNGTGSGNNNSLSLIADNQTGTEVNAVTILQDGTAVLTVNPQFKTTNFTSTPIQILDDTTTYGHTMLVGAGGTTYVGAGEAASGLYNKLGVKTTEDLILGADSAIRFHTGADNATNINGVTLDTTNAFFPQTNNTGSLGSATKKWNRAYASIFKDGYLENYFGVDTSRALNIVNLYDSDNTTLHMHIGAHNTGNTTGAIYIIPYPKTKDAWTGEEGLYIAKNLLKLDNNRVPTTGNTTGTIGSTSKAVYVDAGVIKEISTLAISKGGTGTSTAPTQGGVIYASSTSAYASTAAGSSGQLLQSAGTGKPSWITATNSNTASTVVKRDSSGNFSAGTITANLTGTASKVNITSTNRSSGTTYMIPFMSSTGSQSLLGNDGIGYWTIEGTTSALGAGELKLGNNKASGTAGNKRGMIYMYGQSSGYTEIIPSNNTASNVQVYLPSSGGTIALTSSNITGSSASCTGNAATATKLATARNIALSGDFTGSASFNGTANATISATNYKCSVNGGNTNSFPFHRIAYVTGKTGQWVDCDCILDIKHSYNTGGFGRVKISLRTDSTGTAINASAVWLYKYNIKDDAISIAYWGTTGQSCYADVFYNHGKTYPRCTVYQVYGSRVWTLVDSNQPNDGAKPTEAYTTIAAAATALHGGTAYTNIVESAQANSVGILPITGGGTGANTPAGALSNLGGVGYKVVTNLSSLL